MTGPDGWEQVAEVRDLFEARFIALRLREAGIAAEVIDQSFRQEPLPDVRSFAVVRVMVPAGEEARAREVLERSPWLSSDLSDEPELAPAGGRDEPTGEDEP
ncbi:MAG TPA: DUF2007 domain-containing protein [Vicinamibacteria bacterium]|nr:DUF2007 domain-containing protein [Vicinamibacteria bacterium]